MSKKLTRKGLALGTALAFGLSGLSALPASAATEKLLTISPQDGASQNGVIDTELWVDVIADELAPNYGSTVVKVSNPSEIAIDFDGEEEVFVLKNGKKEYAQTTGGYYTNSELYVLLRDSDGDAGLGIYTDEETGSYDLTLTAWQDRTSDLIVGSSEASSVSDPYKIHLFDPATLTVSAQIDGTGDDGDILQDNEDLIDYSLKFVQDVNIKYVDLGNFGVVAFIDGENVELNYRSYNTGDDLGAIDYDVALWDYDEYDDNYDNDSNTFGGIVDLAGALDNGEKIQVRPVYYNQQPSTSVFEWAGSKSVAFSQVAATDDTDLDHLSIAIADSSDKNADGYELRAGTKTIDYVLQLEKSDNTAVERSGVPVRVYLTDFYAGSYESTINRDVPTNAPTATIVGSKTRPVTDDSWLAINSVNGKTNADGQFAFSVTVTDANADAYYYLNWGYVDEAGALHVEDSDAGYIRDGYGDEFYYEDASVDNSTFEATETLLAGTSVTAKFTVEDQFGQPISVDDSGKALKVQLEDPSDDTLFKKSVNVVAGTATVTFSNYLAKGDQSSLKATLYSGNSVTTGQITTTDVDLYNPEAAGKVNVDEEITGDITYEDFVTGDPTKDEDDDTNAPTNNGEVLSGDIEDISGAGLPGAVVTVSAKGLQFQKVGGTDFFKDSITLVAEADGTFQVNVWAHKVDEDGIVITTTSGGKSATTKFITDWDNSTTAPADIAENLKLSWNAPSHPAINQTYVVTTVVSDKWGNVLEDAELDYSAGGSLEVNGNDSVSGKTTNTSGKSTVYARSVKDADGFAELTVELVGVTVNGVTLIESDLDAAEWSNKLVKEVIVGKSASAKAITAVSGKLAVAAYNSVGKTITVYAGGKLVATKVSNRATFKFSVLGLKSGNKNVTVKIGGKTFFTDYVTIK